MNIQNLHRRIMAILLCFAMVLGMMPVTALAAGETFNADISQGDVSVTAQESGQVVISYYDSEGNPYEKVPYSADDRIVITGSTTENRIAVEKTTANITLDNVNIDKQNTYTPAFVLGVDAEVNLTLKGTNILKSGMGYGGLNVMEGALINIDGDGSLEANGNKSSAGIGGGMRGKAGTININGGIITAKGGESNGGILPGIGGGEDAEGGTVTITGGTINPGGICNTNDDHCYISGGSVYLENPEYIYTIPQVSADDDTQVYMTTVTLDGIDKKTEVDSLSITYDSNTYPYGTNDMYTDESGKLYLWLPDGATVTGAEVGETSYSGTVTTKDDSTAAGSLTAGGGAGEDDTTAPTVDSVTPSGEDVAVSGDIKITFNEEMDTDTVGTVSLNDGTDTVNLTDGTWSNENTVYTVSYSELESSKSYTITISGFKDVAGNEMDEDSSNSFTTGTAEENGTWDGTTTDTDWYNDNDSEFTISTAAELAGLSKLVNEGKDFKDKTVKLGDDIVLNDVSNADNWDENTEGLNSWTPIGNDKAYFCGIFDGNGHTVSGIYINNTDSDYKGLFGSIGNDSTVKNVGVTDSYIKGRNDIGSVVGYSAGTVENCYNTGSLIDGDSFCGGVVGMNMTNSKLKNCYNTGSVKGSVYGVAGGVAGGNYGTVENCYNMGSVTGGSNVGGVAGINCHTVTGCYYDKETSGVDGGIKGADVEGQAEGKTTAEMKTSGTFSTWSTDVWIFEANKYPQLIKPESSGGDDTTAPTVGSITPSGEDVAVSGDIKITFNEEMDTDTVGTVSLNDGTDTVNLTDGTWSNENTVYTVAYSELESSKSYTITISGFKDVTGNEMDEDSSNSFTTGTAEENGTWDGTTTDTDWYNDTDSEFTISTAAELAGFSKLVKEENLFIGKTVKLANDIVLNDVSNVDNWDENTEDLNNWTPITTNDADKSFSGTFDGCGHTVSGIYINVSKDYDNYEGLFGAISADGTVKNVGVTDSYIKGVNTVGGVAGYNKGTMINCYNTGKVSGTGMFIGGVVGCEFYKTMEKCYNTGSVSGGEYVGGVAGNNSGGGSISDCYNLGSVSGEQHVGGVVGDAGNLIYHCYNAGSVSGIGTDYIGGLIGKNSAGSFNNITNCYYDKEICSVKGIDGSDKNTTNIQVIGKTTDWMKSATDSTGTDEDTNVFDGWDTDVWVFEANKYPYFTSESSGGDDTTAPTVDSITPSGEDVAVSGNIVITFSKKMDITTGTVSLTDETDPVSLDDGTWSDDNTVYTVAYSELEGDTPYTITISGFKDASENPMDEGSYTFKTAVDVFNYSNTPKTGVFYLRVETSSPNETFIVPTAGLTDGSISYSYNWSIDWGDKTSGTFEPVLGRAPGIPHQYNDAGTYTITIKPNGVAANGWFRSFGFRSSGLSNNDPAYSIANKKKLTGFAGSFDDASMDFNQHASYAFCEMFIECWNLTAANIRINTNITYAGNLFASEMFEECMSLTELPDDFNLPSQITTVGSSFAVYMFKKCKSLKKLPDGFNLPSEITGSVGGSFASSMFNGCESLETLPTEFNLPSQITTVANNFAGGMFVGCKSLETLPTGFTMPSGITSVGNGFAASMFEGCCLLGTLPTEFNLPSGIKETVGMSFAQNMFNGCKSLETLPTGFNLPIGITGTGGGQFAQYMFKGCESLKTLPTDFNLPSGITVTEPEYCFALGMFEGCKSLETLPTGFNLPSGIKKTVGDSFAQSMFEGCESLKTLPTDFNFPSEITEAGTNFALNMFKDCTNLKINKKFKFPNLSQVMINKRQMFINAMSGITAEQYPGAAANILSNLTDSDVPSITKIYPKEDRDTFSEAFKNDDSWNAIHAYWKVENSKYESKAPTVGSITPSGTDVAVSGDIKITFSKAMDTDKDKVGTVSLTDGTDTVDLTDGTWSDNGKVYTIAYSELEFLTSYTIKISGFKDSEGNVMKEDSSKKFTTAKTPLTISSIIAKSRNDANAKISVNGLVEITFSKAMDTDSVGTITLHATSDGDDTSNDLILTDLDDSSKSWKKNDSDELVEYVIPYTGLEYGKEYSIRIDNGFKSADGSELADISENTYKFTTKEKPVVSNSDNIYFNGSVETGENPFCYGIVDDGNLVYGDPVSDLGDFSWDKENKTLTLNGFNLTREVKKGQDALSFENEFSVYVDDVSVSYDAHPENNGIKIVLADDSINTITSNGPALRLNSCNLSIYGKDKGTGKLTIKTTGIGAACDAFYSSCDVYGGNVIFDSENGLGFVGSNLSRFYGGTLLLNVSQLYLYYDFYSQLAQSAKYCKLTYSDNYDGSDPTVSYITSNDEYTDAKNKLKTAKYIYIQDAYAIDYDSNGGTGTVPERQMTAMNDSNPTIASGSSLSKDGLRFNGWNTAADGKGDDYAAGASYSAKKSVKLYAQWVENTLGVISVDAGTTPDADGSIAITFSEPMDTTAGEVYLTDGTAKVKLSGGTWSEDGTVYTVSYSDLAYNTEYTVHISDFKAEADGTVISADSSKSFTTKTVDNALTGTAKITGDAVCNGTLTASLDGGNSEGELSYQWMRDGKAIAGATDATYKLTADDIGTYISVKITSTDKQGTQTSASTDKVVKANGGDSAVTPTVSDMTDASITDTSITVTAKDGYEYIIVPSGEAISTGTWQDSNTFTDLTADTEYDIYQRIKATDTTNASDPSEALTIKTKFTVTYNFNYDEATEPYTTEGVSEGEKATMPKTPQREGYTFDGWYKEGTCTNAWDFSNDTVNDSMTLYAKWKEYVLSVISVDAGTTPDADGSIAIKFSEPMDTTAGEVYLTDGTAKVKLSGGTWSDDGTVYTVSYSDLAYDTEYTVQISDFKSESDGTVISADSSNKFSTKTVDDALTGTATITGDAVCNETLTASLTDGNSTGELSYQWMRDGKVIDGATGSTYKLTVDDIGADISVKITSNDKQGTLTSASTAEVVKADCKDTAVTSNTSSKTDTSITVTAKDGYEYIIVPTGEDISTGTWQDSNTFTDLTPGKEYDIYQRIKATDTTNASEPSEALTIKTKLTVKYNWNIDEATEPYTSNGVSEGEKAVMPAAPQRAGYIFGGWYKDNDCNNAWDFNNAVNDSMTLYAKWTAKTADTLEVVYADGGADSGSVPKDQKKYKLDDTVTVKGNMGSLSKSGASFTGWSDGTTTYTAGNTITIKTNMVLTAVWTEITTQYTVTYSNNYSGGGNYTTQTVKYGSLLTKPATPTRDGYTFIGWYKNADCTDPWSFDLDTVTSEITLYTKWAQGTYSVSGTVEDDTMPIPGKVAGATVKVMQGNIQFGDTVLTNSEGKFIVTGVPNGEYNIVITKDGHTVTLHIEVSGSNFTYEGKIVLPSGNKNSRLDIIGLETPNIVEDGLDDLFDDLDNHDIYDENSTRALDEGGTVEIRLTVQKDDNAKDKETVYAKMSSDGYKSGITLDVDIEKTVTDKNGAISEEKQITSIDNPITLIIPLPEELQGKSNYVVYRTHDYGEGFGVKVDKITTTKNDDNEYIEISADKTYLTLHAKFFSTYSIGYSESNNDSSDKKSSGGYSLSSSKDKSYDIKVTASEGGNISPSGSVSVVKGKDKTFTFTPDEGYVISDVLIDGKSVGAVESYTFTDMDSAHTINVVFVKSEGLPYYLDDEGNKVFIGFAASISGEMKYIAPEDETIQLAQNPKYFTDTNSHWAKAYIDFAAQREIFAGTGTNTFSPDEGMTRAMFATVIGRLYERSYGKITSTGVTFSDVPAGMYYTNYVNWAEKNGIISGVGDNKFAPNQKITREEMATILYRFAEFLKVSGDSSDIQLSYPDSAQIDAWAIEAIKYCQQSGLILGRSEGDFAPHDTATRAEVAAILQRFVETVVK